MLIRKLLPIRRVLTYLLISFVVGSTVYIKQSAIYKAYVEHLEFEITSLRRNYEQEQSLLEAQLNSLVSRIKHLSEDNSRLTSTGHKLFQQVEDSNSSLEEKLAASRKLHLELSSLDLDIIHKYESYIEHQKHYEKLRHECKSGKIKTKACDGFTTANEEIRSIEQQIKHLHAKREILVSQLERKSF